jgi:enolase-phosphatase E1
MNVRAVLLDIEGTTSSIDFVHKVLFPYAVRELPDFIRRNCREAVVAALLDDVRSEQTKPMPASKTSSGFSTAG